MAMREAHVTERSISPALHSAMDELSRRQSAFDVTSADLARTWTAANAATRAAFDLAHGCYVAARAGHYLFVASAGQNVRLVLTRNGADAAEPLEAQPTLLVAALQLAKGDVVGLRVTLRCGTLADVTTPVRWRGAKV